MKFRISLLYLITCLTLLTLVESCRKPVLSSTGHLNFSLDTLLFDTVFTSVGSTTQHFKLYNRENKFVEIESIELVGGTNSPFRINVDGVSGTSHKNLQLEGKDSLFVFVEVTLNVNGGNLPLIVEDSIRFRTNGVDQYVNLAVWGQDAYFHHLDENEGTWLADKPHVVYDAAFVLEDKSLLIAEGARVHFHKNSILFVKKGKLTVDGKFGNEVVFEGDRLESFYSDVAGQWYGIYLDSCLPSSINYAVIKNGTSGIHVTGNNPKNGPSIYSLEVKNSIISNHASYGVFLYLGAKLKMENTLVVKNGRHALFSLAGGSFNINQCNLLSYANSDEEQIAVAVKNYFTQNGQTLVGEVEEGKIYNSVIFGYQDYEMVLDTMNLNNTVNLNFDFKNCLIKAKTISTSSQFESVLWNTDPNFASVPDDDYHIQSTSILNGNANPFYSLLFDQEGKLRSTIAPDIGIYESN